MKEIPRLHVWFQPYCRILAEAGYEVSPDRGTVLIGGREQSLVLELRRKTFLGLTQALAAGVVAEKPDWIEAMDAIWRIP